MKGPRFLLAFALLVGCAAAPSVPTQPTAANASSSSTAAPAPAGQLAAIDSNASAPPAAAPTSSAPAKEAAEDGPPVGILGQLRAEDGPPAAPPGRAEDAALGIAQGEEAGWGIVGVGEGGTGEGRLGGIGPIGHGAGGYGTGPGGGRRRPASRVTVRIGTPEVYGRLTPEVIQRIVRKNHGRLRSCYEHGLFDNPALQGKVKVRFQAAM